MIREERLDEFGLRVEFFDVRREPRGELQHELRRELE
jgi:hypothetical protein